jgi:hypothetical protein
LVMPSQIQVQARLQPAVVALDTSQPYLHQGSSFGEEGLYKRRKRGAPPQDAG